MTAITNGRCFGSGFWVCPNAEIDDGLLDVMVADGIGRLRILRLIPKITKGTHLNEPILSNQTRHLEIQILEKKLRVIV
jgi:diacylglycerol kinase (ATP)